MVALRRLLRGRAAFPLTGIISAIVDKSAEGHGILWTFYLVTLAWPWLEVKGVVVSNLLQDLGKSGFVHFDELLSQVSSSDF
jgi:hypothetical protein